MAGHIHRGQLGSSAWRRNITGAGHAPPRSTGGHAPPIAPRLPEVDNASARGDDLIGVGEWSPAEVLRYCGLVSAYNAFHGTTSAFRCAGRRLLPVSPGHGDSGYVGTVSLYATVDTFPGKPQRHRMGYVAVATERDHAGYRDIVVVWRGTEGLEEILKDIQANLVPMPMASARGVSAPRRVLVELKRRVAILSHGGARALRSAWDTAKVLVSHGFSSLYTSSCDTCDKHGNASAQGQVVGELKRLVEHFIEKHPDEKIRVTVTGHSLGGALALLTARDAADKLPGAGGVDRVPVSAVTFGAPRVGNREFGELLTSCGVRMLRVFIRQDMVPRLPLSFMGYVHAGGDELKLSAPLKYLLGFFHRLYIYLDLLRVRVGENSPAGQFQWADAEMPAPEPDKIDLPLKLSKLDEMIYSDKEMISPRPRMDDSIMSFA